ncbi:hypothetical protein CSKR_108692, partial [Clonorchis sinensis]
YVSHEEDHLVRFYIGGNAVVLFKTKLRHAESRIALGFSNGEFMLSTSHFDMLIVLIVSDQTRSSRNFHIFIVGGSNLVASDFLFYVVTFDYTKELLPVYSILLGLPEQKSAPGQPMDIRKQFTNPDLRAQGEQAFSVNRQLNLE